MLNIADKLNVNKTLDKYTHRSELDEFMINKLS